MKRGPRWELEAAREARRTVRLAAGIVPLTVAERRLLELLVDTTSSEQELREACGYREVHPHPCCAQKVDSLRTCGRGRRQQVHDHEGWGSGATRD